MTFCLIPKALDARDVMVVFAYEYLAMLHTPMMNLRYIHPSETWKLPVYTMLSGNTFSRRMGISVESLASGMIAWPLAL